MVNEMFNGMFGKVGSGMCKLTTSGRIAVNCGGTYKSYNPKNGKLTNCGNFVLPVGDDFFFVIPTNKVEVGDIILVNKKPRFVKEVGKNQITVINYENSTIETILPERHMFMGNTYFYGKIVSMFGDSLKGKGGANNMMKYMMMSEMMKGNNGMSGMGSMLPFMMMSGGNFENMFSGIFDDASDDEVEDVEVVEEDQAVEDDE